MCQKHLKHIIARDQRSPRSKSSGCYSFECKERNLITRVWTSYHVKLTQSTELEQKRFDLRSVPPAGTPLSLVITSTVLQRGLSQESLEVRRTDKLMFFYRYFLILMLLLQIASMLLVKYFYRRNVPPKAFLDRQNGRKYS